MIRALLIFLLLLVVGGYGAWPYYSLQRFDDALERGDEAALAQMVDWTALRSGLEREVAVLRGDEAGPRDGETVDAPTTGSEVLSALLAPAVQDLLVDAYQPVDEVCSGRVSLCLILCVSDLIGGLSDVDGAARGSAV